MEKNQIQVVKPDKISFIQKLKLKRKIAVPDIKQYLADEFKLVNEQEKFIQEQGDKIRKFEVMAQKYDISLITLNEYKERIEKYKKQIDKLTKSIEEQKVFSKSKVNEVNDYKIKCNKMEKELNKLVEKQIDKYKQKLKKAIQEHKGTLTKISLYGYIDGTTGSEGNEI